MKKFVMIFTVLFLMVGCGNTADNTSSTEMIEVDTEMGKVEVPKNPERVVVNWYVGDVISLDLPIAGYFAWNQESMPYHDKLNDLHKIEAWEAEEIMTLKPDLIITYDQEDFTKLSKIAPVVVISDSGMDTIERTEYLGKITNKEAEAKKAVDTFTTKLAEAKKTLDGDAFAGKTFSVMEDWGPSGEWAGVYYETGSRGGTLLYDYLDLKYPDKLGELIEKTGEGRGSISYEVAHEYFGDYIIWFQKENEESEYAKTEIWKSIPAVKEGRVVEIPGNMLGLFFYSDITSLTQQLDYMIDAINTVVK